jgi:hypothetical protein
LRQTALTANKRVTLPNYISPEELWYSDLKDLIKEKLAQKHEITVAGDFNDNLNDKFGTTVVFMRNLGLKEILLEIQDGAGPATHIQGTNTIDGVFATNGITLSAGQYVEFHKSPSDHRWLVIDITESSLLGTKRNMQLTALTRRVTSKISSIKAKFQTLLEQQIIMHNLHQKICQLFEKATRNEFTHNEEVVYEKIELRMQRAIKWADSHSRKVRRGAIPFTPGQKRLMGAITILNQLRLWILLIGKTNRPRTTRIKRLMKKYKYTGQTKFNSIEEVNSAIQVAHHDYNNYKRNAQSNRWSYLEQIAKEYDDIDGRGTHHHFRILQRNEMNKEYFR